MQRDTGNPITERYVRWRIKRAHRAAISRIRITEDLRPIPIKAFRVVLFHCIIHLHLPICIGHREARE